MNDCRAQLRPQSHGTCEWISSNNRFREWISEKHLGLLCITGDIRSGKSMLTSYSVNQVKPTLIAAAHRGSTRVIACSFFCDDEDVGRNHDRGILHGLLYQIFTQLHSLMDHATARVSGVVPERWSILVLWEILRVIMLNPKNGTLALIVVAIN